VKGRSACGLIVGLGIRGAECLGAEGGGGVGRRGLRTGEFNRVPVRFSAAEGPG
jgi:hypothetical protein